MSMIVYSKQLLTEGTKFRVLCFMYQFFKLDENNIATLANQTGVSFEQLLARLMSNQPNLHNAGAALKSVLESFVSNQNSRIFCALADLFEWYRSNMSFEILQLTLKHINSIFRRAPYELRPYTRELTYAQRVIMIYHACDPSTWGILVDAYEFLYRSQFGKEWKDKEKFLAPTRTSIRSIPPDALRTIQECMAARIIEPSLAQDSSSDWEPSFEPPTNAYGSKALGLGPGLGTRDGRVVRRRAFSAFSRSKVAKAVQMATKSSSSSLSLLPHAQQDIVDSKPRSISLSAVGSSVNAVLKPAIYTDPAEYSTPPPLLFSPANPFAYPTTWLTNAAAPPVPIHRNESGFDFSQATQPTYNNRNIQSLASSASSSQLNNLLSLHSNDIACAFSMATNLTVPPVAASAPEYSEQPSQQTIAPYNSQLDGGAAAGVKDIAKYDEVVVKEENTLNRSHPSGTSLIDGCTQ